MSGLSALAPQWMWFIVAALLATAEMLAPGFFLIWIGGAALIAGFAAMLGLPIIVQLLVFAISAIALVMIARRYVRTSEIPTEDPLLNNRGARLIGTVVTAVEAVDADSGRVKVGDTVWPARGVNADVGARLRVKSVDGGTLIVELA